MFLYIILNLVTFISLYTFMLAQKYDLTLEGIEPNAGPLYGFTRITARFARISQDIIDEHPHPKCRFGNSKREVNATYARCMPRPRKIGETEENFWLRNETCVICEISPPSDKPDIIPFTISFLGDFTDSVNSLPYRYYKEPKVIWIFPRYGDKDGGTMVEIFGENFINFDQNLRCGFGSEEAQGYFVSSKYMICYTPSSDIVQKEMPFTVSFNNQQSTRQFLYYVYFDHPQVSRLEPSRGPDTGGTLVNIRGVNFFPMHHIKEKHGWDNLNDTLCRFGNLSITQANVISHTEMECESPPSYEDREVPVEITLNTREWTSDGVIFTYYHPPFVYGIAPRIGPVSGNTTVVVTGSNFENTGYVRCKFGDIFTKGEYISENELRCISPKVEKPGFVKLSIAIREDEFSSGLSTKYLYYDTPLITGQSPYCGPESGFTQITVKGDNFADTGSDNVKCIFDGNIRMNATVMNEHEIKCDSPSVLNYKGINEKNIKYYDVMITLNGVDFNGPAHKFYYYKDTIISKLDPFYGPISGNTTVDMTGFNFNQTGACNPVVRFSTYEVKPKIFNNTNLQVVSPKVNWTGATTVQLALNGQQFDKDITIRYRDFENTFWYYKNPLVTFMSPNKGPTIGGTNIKVLGIGFDEIFAYQKDPKKKKLYYKFIDKKDNKTQYGNTFLTKVKNNHALELITPGVYKNGTVTEVYISYNNQNFDKIENNTFTFYVLPNITKLEPKYGPLKATNYKKIKLTLDNYICTENCDILICRYKSKNTIFYEKGIYLDANWVNCTIPRVNSPESFNVELSFNNGDDWTNNGFTYTFYDPYIISVHPQMVSTRGGTTVKIHGLGFANSGPNLKVRFGGEKPSEKLECNYGECNKKAKYIQDTDLEVKTFPQEIVNYLSSGKSVKFNKFAVEVSVYNDDFTNNNMTIFYYKEPELGSDEDIGAGLDPKTKKMIRDSLIRSLPANLDTMIGIPINTRAIMDSFSTIEMYANYTCKYTMKKTNVTKTTKGIISSIPLEKDLKNMFLCQSPEWSEVGEGNISISLNGYDFSESTYKIEFTDPISMVKMYPMCGPLQGKTEVTILGTGFVRSKKMIFKWGVQNLVAMSSSSLLETLDSSKTDPSIIRTSKFEIKKVDVRAPRAPFYLKTQGGLDYISISKLSFFPLSDFVSQFFTNQYIHTNYEYYYYKQPYIQSFSPHGSIVTGGTSVLVVGAWFQNKPEYGVKPFCKFGNNIVEGEFLSTVRITCTSPPSEKINVRVPFDVSLNGVDFTHSDLKFTYYNDFSKAAFIDMDPKSGPSTGGTVIKLYGSNFTSLLDPDEFLCQFKPNDARMQPKNVPAGFKQYDDGRQAIICNTPGGWMSGSIANILITFDGQKFVDSSFKFYFYKMTDYIPKSGPNTGNGPIHVKGSGFKNSTKVKCILDRRQNIKPISIDTRDILCPMPKANKGGNFTGKVDFGISLNGIDKKVFQGGFYYYQQPYVTDIFPRTGPSKGKGLVKIFGKGFRNDFPGVNLGCKVGDAYGVGTFISTEQINCIFPKLILNERNSTMNFSVAMNNYSFIPERNDLNFTPYGIISMNPSSGPIVGSTNIVVKGSGFIDSPYARCRFGVEGYFAETAAKFIDSKTVICSSPYNYILPAAGKLPFSVPFSIAFIEDEFNPWTETTHFYSFYDNPEIVELNPKETKTSVTKEVMVWANIDKPFSLPSATVVEEDEIDYSSSNEGTVRSKQSFDYLPIACRFGRFGVTIGKYVNRTLIKCITPAINDDSDIAREEVSLAVALNGWDFISNDNLPFTFIGPSSGTMIWYYLFMIILIVGTIVGLSTLISQHWNNVLAQLRNKAEGGDIPHTIDRRPRYLEQENLSEKMLGDQPVEGGGQQGGGDRARGGIPHSPKGGTNSMRMRDN